MTTEQFPEQDPDPNQQVTASAQQQAQPQGQTQRGQVPNPDAAAPREGLRGSGEPEAGDQRAELAAQADENVQRRSELGRQIAELYASGTTVDQDELARLRAELAALGG